MSSDYRTIMNILTEGLSEAPAAPKPVQKDVKNSIEVLRRQYGAKAAYPVISGYKNLDSVLKALPQYVSKFATTGKKDVKPLVDAFRGLRQNPKLTDKEHYLRQGFESIGFTSNEITLVWFKDTEETLHIYAENNEDIAALRDFFRYFSVIK